MTAEIYWQLLGYLQREVEMTKRLEVIDSKPGAAGAANGANH